MNPLKSGIKTRENLKSEPYGFVVEWIDWDSDFRNSNLEHADIIVAVDTKKYLKEKREVESQKAIGNYLESIWWQEQCARNEQIITLEVVRDGKSLHISAKIQEEQLYYNSDNKATLGVNGPVRLSRDGFSNAWANWYDSFITHASLYIDDKLWERTAIDNRNIIKYHLEWKPRIDFLIDNYSGKFANAVLADWTKVKDILEGNTYSDITEKDLEYREIGAKRESLIKETAIKERDKFIRQFSEKSIAAFPAMDVVNGNVLEVVGKLVALPTITFDNFINDLGKSYAVIGSQNDGYYFIHLNSKEMDAFFKATFNYKSQVSPNLSENFQFFAEILKEPTLLSYNGRAVTGLMVKVVAGMAGDDNVFIKINNTSPNGRASFEGEDLLNLFSVHTINDSSSPEEVINAMIQYIKIGDKPAWEKLFCNWRVYPIWEGPAFIDMTYFSSEETYYHEWEKSRKQIVNDIYDARILHISPIKIMIEEDKKAGLPKVEQVKIIIDHIGKIDGFYKSVSNLNLHRKWILQRLNDGPWKITELQSL